MLRQIISSSLMLAIALQACACNKKFSPTTEYDKIKYESFIKNDFDTAMLDLYLDTFFLKYRRDAQGRVTGGYPYRYIRDSMEIHITDGFTDKKVRIKDNCGKVYEKAAPTNGYFIDPDFLIERISRKCFPVIVEIDGKEYRINNNTDYSRVQFSEYPNVRLKILYSNQDFMYL